MAIVVAEQAQALLAAIEPSIEMEICPYVSEGDRIKGDLKPYGGKGTFIKDLERRLLSGEIDCAIHALKDIPGDVPMHDDLMLVAFLAREDARDALVLRAGLTEEQFLEKKNVIVGTSAPRRQIAARKLYPDCTVTLSRGNVNTRLAKLDAGEFDALILSGSGLGRIGFENRITRLFSEQEILPAIGQGILCLQIRREDFNRCTYLQAINNEHSQNAATAEREILSQLQGNCHSAIAAHCREVPGGHTLNAAVYNPDGDDVVSASMTHIEGSVNFKQLGAAVAQQLLDGGCRKYL